jgi:adenosine deaminase CECR1
MTQYPDLAKYEAERADLINRDRSLRGDHVRSSFSTSEAKADKVVREIRAEEASSIWSTEYASIPHPFPGMEFLTGR